MAAQAQPAQVPGHIPKFPHIDLRWSKDAAIPAFAGYNIGRPDLSPLTIAEYNTGMRRCLASAIKSMSLGEFTPHLSNFECEPFERPISERWSIKIKYISHCFLNNALIPVNPKYSDGASASEIMGVSDKRYIRRSNIGGFWFQGDKDMNDKLIEVDFHKNANIVSYINKRYYLSLCRNLIINWNGMTGAKTSGTTRDFSRDRKNT